MPNPPSEAQSFSVKRAEVEFHNFASLGEPERAAAVYAEENRNRGAVIRNHLPFIGQLSLVRYDMPRGLSDGYAPTRQLAQNKADQDAVDWPDFTLNGKPIFRGKAEENIALKLRRGAEAKPLFQAPGDDVVQPGNHWLRALETPPDRLTYFSTADLVALKLATKITT